MVKIDFVFLARENPYTSEKSKQTYYTFQALIGDSVCRIPTTLTVYNALKDVKGSEVLTGEFSVKASFGFAKKPELFLESLA